MKIIMVIAYGIGEGGSLTNPWAAEPAGYFQTIVNGDASYEDQRKEAIRDFWEHVGRHEPIRWMETREPK
jgi:hypothetical protein